MPLFDSRGSLILPTRSQIAAGSPGLAQQVEAVDQLRPHLMPGMPAYESIMPRMAGEYQRYREMTVDQMLLENRVIFLVGEIRRRLRERFGVPPAAAYISGS